MGIKLTVSGMRAYHAYIYYHIFVPTNIYPFPQFRDIFEGIHTIRARGEDFNVAEIELAYYVSHLLAPKY